ncbi:phage tail protein [Asticcacaulis solisilvae]|uniref:phage tail protein n=1 Tax=Asticcacaulis solisilvae TaxID=1217274 RepID=UPI003FD74A44
MMMTLGLFGFEIGTLPYQELARQTEWRYGKGDRFRARPAVQYLGPGTDKITLTGALYPSLAGKFSSLDTIRSMADAGQSYLMLDGLGNVMGSWIINSLSDNRSIFFVDGVARKGEFTIELERVSDA